MKNLVKVILCVSLLAELSFAQTQKKKTTVKTVTTKTTTLRKKVVPKVYTQSKSSVNRQLIQSAITQYKNGSYVAAANTLQALAKKPEMANERPQLKMYLGEALMELNLNQTAAFQFVDVIKSGGTKTRAALEKLLIVTDRLGDETLLNYALQRIDVANVPVQHRDMLNYRLGEIKMAANNFSAAAQLFGKVGPQSRYYYNALYNKGLSEAEANQTDLALSTFNKLKSVRTTAKVTDTNKVAAQMAIARTLYQKKSFEASIDAYSKIPRDHFMWHDALFEKSWAMLRTARFRSALSNFQTLHSSYYDDFYIPETLLLRSIVYLYICKYDETEKTLGLYEKQYSQLHIQIQKFLRSQKSADVFYSEVEKAGVLKKSNESDVKTVLPLKVLNKIYQEGNVRRSMTYIKKLYEEKTIVEENPQLRSSAVGKYSLRVISNRIKGAKAQIGDMVKAHLENMEIELKDLQDQASLIRYEMINGQKETIRKKITGKDLSDLQVDNDRDRSFYVQNGYEYYPFQGEYWLDEVGNYHYLGKQSCE